MTSEEIKALASNLAKEHLEADIRATYDLHRADADALGFSEESTQAIMSFLAEEEAMLINKMKQRVDAFNASA